MPWSQLATRSCVSGAVAELRLKFCVSCGWLGSESDSAARLLWPPCLRRTETHAENPTALARSTYWRHAFTVPSIGFRSRFSQCVDYMRFNEKSFCFRWQETTKLMLFFNTETSSLVILCDLRYLTGNISSVMTKHMGVQRKLHRFAYLIVQIILGFYS